MSYHHIDAAGEKILCAAPVDAYCRRVPACDTEMFTDEGCNDHNPKHPVLEGQPCWMAEGANACSLPESYQDWVDEPRKLAIIPGAAVDLINDGEEGTHWEYAAHPSGCQLRGRASNPEETQ